MSGGLDSALVAIEITRRYGKENVILVNHECKLEDEDVARFENQVADYLGLPITYASFEGAKDKDQFDVVIDKGSFINPHDRQALCTHVMKTEPFMRYLDKNFPTTSTLFDDKKECVVYYGFSKDEPTRILRRSSIMAAHGYRTAFPRAHWVPTINSTAEIGIDPPLVYKIWRHANCKGCLKAGWQHWYCVFVLEPDIWEKGKLSEKIIGYSIHKDAYLEEKEELFNRMVKAGIEPTERIQSSTWWAAVKKILKEQIELPEEEEKPCVCFT